MKKAKFKLHCKIPSWNFCNLDIYTQNKTYSKKTCRFCQKNKEGYHCLIYNEPLKNDPTFVYKTSGCINATAGFEEVVTELQVPPVDPKTIVRETVKEYTRVLKDLMSQGYPQGLAEKLAIKYVTGEDR